MTVQGYQLQIPGKVPCRLATTANHGLTGLTDIDGVTPVAGDRILVMVQTAGEDNGIYVAAAGAWARALDMDDVDEDLIVAGLSSYIQEGTTKGGTTFVITTPGTIVLGSTSLTIVDAATSGGTGVLADLEALGPVASDGQFIVGTGVGVFAYESGATARTSMGVAIGTDVQAWDADLNALAALATTGIVARTGAATYVPRTLLGGTAITVTDGDGVAAAPSIAVTAGAITEDLLSFSFVDLEVLATAFSYDGTRSNYTVASAASSNANVLDFASLQRNGSKDHTRVTTTAAQYDWSISGTTVSVHGDITGDADTYQLAYIAGTASGSTPAVRVGSFDTDVSVIANDTLVVKWFAPADITVTGIKLYSQTAPTSAAGTYTFAVDGDGNNLISTATFDLESLSAATLTATTLTATTANLDLVEGNVVTFTFVSDNADLTATGLYLQLIYEAS